MHRLSTILSALSLLLCLATVVLWVRSYMILDKRGIRGEDWYWSNYRGEVDSGEGEIDYTWWYSGFVHGQQVTNYWHGFGFKHNDDCLMIDVPHWFLAAIASILPVVAISRIARRRRTAGFCVACGYDLRATPDQCPECGEVVRKTEISD